MEGRSHFDLYQGGLMEQIAKEMYAVARPLSGSKTKLKPSSAGTHDTR
jgi:hypothetical protein